MLRIRQLREAKGINMRETARLLNLPYTTYVNYEKGLREPTSEVLIQIADFYGVSIDYLIGRSSSIEYHPANSHPIAEYRPMLTEEPSTRPNNSNIIRIAARNGTYQERILTDEQLAALEAILNQMPDVADDI